MTSVGKFKVFMANGTIQTILAERYEINWTEHSKGVLRFFSRGLVLAVFPPGGWLGLQDIDVTNNNTKVEV